MSTERIGQPTKNDLLSNVDNKVQVDVSTCNTYPIHQSNIDKYRSEVAQHS